MESALELCCELIRRPSLTPDDAGCQALIAERLQAAGFQCRQLPFGEVDNLWAERGDSGPLLLFAGHTDVVPSGPPQQWQSPPFEPTVTGDMLVGRGAADMKASLAAMVVACERFVQAQPNHGGRLGLLVTSDEEGAAVDGTARVVEWLQRADKRIDWCLVGEPSSEEQLGDVIKQGRRGSLSGRLTVLGVQGHTAYPQRADNPIHKAVPALTAFIAERWDEGDQHFPPTALQLSNINSGTGAGNVIPGTLTLDFNFRFSPAVSEAELRRRSEALFDAHSLNYRLDWELGGQPFLSTGGKLLTATVAAIRHCLGREPRLSTAGGTSDGRFIIATGAEVLELGPVNATIHQVNEQLRVADIEALTQVYQHIIEQLLGGDREL